MKTTLITIAALFSAHAFCDETTTRVNATASLKDGTVLKAEFLSENFIGSTLFAEKLTLRPELVRFVTFGSDGKSNITLTNDDSFAISLLDPSYKLSSSLGVLDVSRENIKTLSLKTAKGTDGNNDGLIFHCSFDSNEAVDTPEVGPKACYNRANLAEGKFGQALFATRYTPQAAFDLPAKSFDKAGCIEFWAKILKPSFTIGWGGDPRIFTLTDTRTGMTCGNFDIVSNDGTGNSGFVARSVLGNIMSIRGMPHDLSYSDLFTNGNYRDWHHYAIVWDDDGIEGLTEKRRMALLIDGKLIPCGKTENRSLAEARTMFGAPLRLSFTNDPRNNPDEQTKSNFLLDEFKIWNYAKIDFTL